MNEMIEKLKGLVKDQRTLLGIGAALFFVILFVFISINKPKKVDKVAEKTKNQVITASVVAGSTGLFLGEDVDRKAFVGRLEDQYHHSQEKSRQLEAQLDALDKKLVDLVRSQGAINDHVLGLETKVSESAAKAIQMSSGDTMSGSIDPSRYRLEVVNVSPVSAAEPEGVYLPSGSFVRGTLLTGVYAPVDQNNPLPVLIRLNEAFYGPNETRVPLEGAFVIGKATGELNSERALIQAVTLSAVLSDGKEFQHQGNVGYVTDIFGELGLKGVVVRNTGAQMAAAFMTGFMGGGSQALAESQTTSQTTTGGRVVRNVTGDVGKYAAFSGLAQSASQMSKYYADQLNAIVPAVRVEAGVDVYLIILEGVRINGLKVNKFSDTHYLD